MHVIDDNVVTYNTMPDEVIVILLPFLDTIYDMQSVSLVSGRWYRTLHTAWVLECTRAKEFAGFLTELSSTKKYLLPVQDKTTITALDGLLKVMSTVHELKRAIFTALNRLEDSELQEIEQLSQGCERPKTCVGIFELTRIYKVKCKQIPYAYNQSAALPQIARLWITQGYFSMATAFAQLIDNTKERTNILDQLLAGQVQDDIDKGKISFETRPIAKSSNMRESSQKLRNSAIDLMLKGSLRDDEVAEERTVKALALAASMPDQMMRNAAVEDILRLNDQLVDERRKKAKSTHSQDVRDSVIGLMEMGHFDDTTVDEALALAEDISDEEIKEKTINDILNITARVEAMTLRDDEPGEGKTPYMAQGGGYGGGSASCVLQ
jgi:hypothetical protein